MILGVDIGGTKIAVGIVSPAGRVLRFANSPTESKQGGKRVLKNIKTVISQHLNRSVTAIGIGIAGQVDYERGVFRGGPNLPHDFKNVRLMEILQQEFHLPIAVENDARCFTIAEATHGIAKKYDRVVGVTIGTGVGGGMVGNRLLLRGAKNTAGEFGHMIVDLNGPLCSCQKFGHLESYSSTSGMMRRYRELSGRTVGAHELEDLYLKRNKCAKRVVEEGARALATGLANILVIANPDCIVLGGGFANFRSYINLALREIPELVPFPHLKKTPILLSKLGPHAGIIGAALLTKNHKFQASSIK